VDSDEECEYFREIYHIIETILNNLQASLRSSGTELIIVNIPLGRSFYDVSSLKVAR